VDILDGVCPVTATSVGLMGEMIAAASVIDNGWSVSHCPQDGCDLLAFKDDCFIRIEVKTANMHKEKRYRSPSYHFNCCKGGGKKRLMNRSDADALALCNPDERLVLWLPITQVSFKTRRIVPTAFTRRAETDSWDKMVAAILEMRS